TNGGYRAARGETLRAARVATRDPREVAAVASRLAAFGLGGELGRYVDGLGSPERIPIPLLMALARQCSLVGDQGRALRLLDEVHRADPEFPPGLLARAQVLMYMGRLRDAVHDVDRCLQRAPEIAHAHWLRSRLGAVGLEPDYPGRLQQRLARADHSAQDQAFRSEERRVGKECRPEQPRSSQKTE